MQVLHDPVGDDAGLAAVRAAASPLVDAVGDVRIRDAEVSRMGGPVPPMFWLRDPDQNSLIVVGSAE